MNSKVSLFRQQSFFNFFGEKSFSFQFVKTEILNLIALRFDDFDFGLNSDLFELALHKIGLPECEFTSS
jgi:hypothetical protein